MVLLIAEVIAFDKKMQEAIDGILLKRRAKLVYILEYCNNRNHQVLKGVDFGV